MCSCQPSLKCVYIPVDWFPCILWQRYIPVDWFPCILWQHYIPMRTSTKNTMLSSTFSHQCDEFLMAARVCAIFSCVIFVHFPGLIDCASHCVCGFLWDVLSVLRQISHSSPDHSYVCCFCVFLPHISHISADFVRFWCFDGRIYIYTLNEFEALISDFTM